MPALEVIVTTSRGVFTYGTDQTKDEAITFYMFQHRFDRIFSFKVHQRLIQL